MKAKGFDKPVKYIFIGQPNTTKTSLAHKVGYKVFETDGLTEEELLDFSKYPLDADVYIIGGKWIEHQTEISTMLSREFKAKYQFITLFFKIQEFETLKFFVEKIVPESYSEGGFMVYISTGDRVLQVNLDDDDGYRSHADVVPDEEVDGFKFWLRMESGKMRVFSVDYDEVLYGFEETTDDREDCYIIVRAKLHGKVVFEIGTNNTDDYYPSYFLMYQEKPLEELVTPT